MPELNDPDEKPIDLDAPIMMAVRKYHALLGEIAELRGELAQLREDRELAERAMQLVYDRLVAQALGDGITLSDLKTAMQALETALRIPGYWPR